MSETWLVLPLLAVLQAFLNQAHQVVQLRPCTPLPEPSMMQYIVEQTDFFNPNAPRNPTGPVHPMTRNPCLELAYYGVDRRESNILTFYGTCNFQEMFRYRTQLVRPYGCWQSELTLWDNRAEPGNCRRFRDHTTLALYNWIRYIIVVEENQHVLEDEINLLVPIVDYYGKHDEDMRHTYNHARIRQCQCNATGRPRLTEAWRRHCSAAEQGPNSRWLWTAMVVGIVVLNGTVVFIFSRHE